MKGTRAALRYAKAILNFAKDKNCTEEVNDDMMLINKTIDDNHDLSVMLKSPIVKSAVKKSTLIKIFEKKTNPVTMGLINLLVENNRLPILQLVAKEYMIIYDFLKGVEIATVTSAIPLTKSLEKQILEKVLKISGKKVTLKNIVDPTIIGGFKLRVGDKQYDSSISNQLGTLLMDFEENHYIPKL